MQLQSFSEEETAAAAFGVFLAGRRASAGSRRWKIREENWGKPEQPGGEWTNLLAETLRSNWSSSCPTRTHESTNSRIQRIRSDERTENIRNANCLNPLPTRGFQIGKKKENQKAFHGNSESASAQSFHSLRLLLLGFVRFQMGGNFVSANYLN